MIHRFFLSSRIQHLEGNVRSTRLNFEKLFQFHECRVKILQPFIAKNKPQSKHR